MGEKINRRSLVHVFRIDIVDYCVSVEQGEFWTQVVCGATRRGNTDWLVVCTVRVPVMIV